MTTRPANDLEVGATGTTAAEEVSWLHQLNSFVGQMPGGSGANTVTIASGAITPTVSTTQVDTEGAAAADDLDTIVGDLAAWPLGSIITIHSVDASRVVTVKHRTSGSGHILLRTATDLQLVQNSMLLQLQRTSADRWTERFRWYGSQLSEARAFLGLGNAATSNLASTSEAKAGTSINTLMSPARTKDALTDVGLVFDQHTVVDETGLSGTNKAMVGRASDVVTITLDDLYTYLFKPHYSSGQLPLTSGQVVAPHGLPTAPIRYRWRLVCVVDQGLIPAGRIITDWQWQTESDNDDGYMMSLDDANFYFTFKELRYFPDSMGNSSPLTLANWRLEIYAWKNA